jgi:aminopeptidase-like protein
MKSIVDAFEVNLFPKINTIGEPQLGKRGLRPNISQTGCMGDIVTRSNFIAYADGNHSVFDISNKINRNLNTVVDEVRILSKHGLITSNKC